MNENQNEFNIYEENKKRKKYLVGALLLVALLGIGYAYLQTTLNISGTTKVSKNTWSIYWDNIQVTDGSVTGTQVVANPTISNSTSVSFSVSLDKPGEYYEFTLDAVNNGTIDAMVQGIVSTVEDENDQTVTLPSYISYTITYEDGIEIANNHLLAKKVGETPTVEKYKVRVELLKTITPEQINAIPEGGLTYNFTNEITYVQADSTATAVREFVYSVSDVPFAVGQLVPAVATYDNYTDAINSFGAPMFIRHIVHDDKVVSSVFGFVYQNEVHYLKGGGATYNESNGKYNNDSIYYEESENLLKSIFGEENCEIYHDTNYKCSDGTIIISYSMRGEVDSLYSDKYCYLDNVDSGCE